MKPLHSPRFCIACLIIPFLFSAHANAQNEMPGRIEGRENQNTITFNQNTITFPSKVIAIAVDPQGQQIYAAAGGQIFVLNRQLKILREMKSKFDFVHDLQVVGQQLWAAGGCASENGGVEIYSIETMKRKKSAVIHSDVIYQLTHDGDRVWTASADRTCVGFQGDQLDATFQVEAHSKQVTCIEWVQGTKLVVSAGLDDTLRIWNGENGKPKFTLRHHQDDVLDLSVRDARDKRLPELVSISRDQTVRFWQPTIGRMVRFKKLESQPTACLWPRGERRVLVGDDMGNLFWIDPQTLQVEILSRLKSPISTIVESPATGKFIVGSGRRLVLIDAAPEPAPNDD